MPLSAHKKNTHWKWGHCDTLIGWLRHVFQMDHGVSIFAPANKYPDAKASIVHFTMAIYDFWHLVSRNFGWWSNALFVLGNVRCYFNRKTKMLWLLMIINILIFAKFLHTRNGFFFNKMAVSKTRSDRSPKWLLILNNWHFDHFRPKITDIIEFDGSF